MTEAARSPKITPGMLSDRETAILDFEKSWWQAKAAKEIEIRDRFGLSKKAFKRAVGRLLKDGAVKIDADGYVVKK